MSEAHKDSGGTHTTSPRRFGLMVAPNGARRGKADHAQLPVRSDEIAATARACFKAGAEALHLHVRDAQGAHSLDAGRYREAMAAVREAAPDMHIQITTESAGIFDVAAQKACLEAVRPAAASISVREMARDPKCAAQVYAVAREVGTDVQHILYSADCVAQLLRWQKIGLIAVTPPNVICVLGSYAPTRDGQVADFAAFHPVMQDGNWWACAFGATEHACLHRATQMGGHVRIGFENSLGDGAQMHASNAASIQKFLNTLPCPPSGPNAKG